VVVTKLPDISAAQLTPGVMNRMTVVLDASHGGTDPGARIGESILEKDVTLSLALKLQSLLAARGFTVAMTRTTDAADKPGAAGTPLTLDDRASIANRARASACLQLHAASSGNGVHLYSSDLDGMPAEAAVMPWSTAQAAWVTESAHLERQLSDALRRSGVPRVAGRAAVRPVDSLTCPAVVVELAPESEDLNSVNDSAYQQRVAEAIAGALELWPTQTQPPPRLPPASQKPKTALTQPAPRVPAPIVRVPAAQVPGAQP